MQSGINSKKNKFSVISPGSLVCVTLYLSFLEDPLSSILSYQYSLTDDSNYCHSCFLGHRDCIGKV